MCLDGDLHLFITNLVVFSISKRRHPLEILSSLMAADAVITSNTLLWRFFSDWLQDPELFSDLLLLCHNQLMTHPFTSLNWVALSGKKELCSKYLDISMASESRVIVKEVESANRDFEHCLEMLLSAMVELVSWGTRVMTMQNGSFPEKTFIVACLHTGCMKGDIIIYTNIILTLF